MSKLLTFPSADHEVLDLKRNSAHDCMLLLYTELFIIILDHLDIGIKHLWEVLKTEAGEC